MLSSSVKKELKLLKNPKKKEMLQRFFKTGKGEYGEGDIFWGIVVPLQRKIAKKYKSLKLVEIKKLLQSPIHECRLTALFILIDKYKKSDYAVKKEIFQFYLNNMKYINNWDLVDLSAPNVIGEYFALSLSKGEKINVIYKILNKLITSKNIWSRRIAILSTFTFIRHGDFQIPLQIFNKLIKDKEDLIHKAVGWMLREIGKRDLKKEIEFLDTYYKIMPRTMLRYAIEKLDKKMKKKYMARKK